MVLALLLLLSASPLEDARAHLLQNKLDDVLFDLDGKHFAPTEQPQAAEVMAQAAQKSLAAKDAVMAIQFSQMALRQNKAQPLALEVGARAFLQQSQFGPAEEYADRWLALKPPSPAAQLLRGQIALEQGEWARALSFAQPVQEEALPEQDQRALARLRAKAHEELGERQSGLSELKTLDQKLAEAATRAARAPRSDPGHNRAAARANGVVVYGTTWCGYCKQARTYFHHKGISFEDKDVEKDPGAAEELAQKAAAAGVHPHGVPVIDVRGHLVEGFDRGQIEKYL